MKLGIFILCHHKQWLLKSTLLTLFLQKNIKKYELNFVLIKGEGKKKRKFYNEQLSKFDDDLIDLIKRVKIKYNIIKVENDDGLDSGAWLKIIKKKKYQKYSYSIFLMEGSIFTNRNVLNDTLNFMRKNNSDVISSGHEKRFFSNEFLNKMYLKNKVSLKNKYLQLQLNKIRKPIIKRLENQNIDLQNDNLNFKVDSRENFRTEYHTPKYKISVYQKFKIFLKSFLKFKDLKLLFHKKIMIYNYLGPLYICYDKISSKIKKVGSTTFHIEKSPFFYGCSCQHIFSKFFLNNLRLFLKQSGYFKYQKEDFFGHSFECIWGYLPLVLKKDKWFFDGIMRPRKNIVTLIREDNNDDLINFINLYYKPLICVEKISKKDFRVSSNKSLQLNKFINLDD